MKILSQGAKDRSFVMTNSGKISICWSITFIHSFNVFAFDQAFNALFDHINVGLEARIKLLDDFGEKVLMGEFLALPKDVR